MRPRVVEVTSRAIGVPRVSITQDNENYLGEDVFKVEAIRRRRVQDGVKEYLIKWEGWASYAPAIQTPLEYPPCLAPYRTHTSLAT